MGFLERFRKKEYSKDKWVVFDFDGTIAETNVKLVEFFNTYVSPKFKVPPMTMEDLDNLRDLSLLDKLKYIKIPVHRLPSLVKFSRKNFRKSLLDLPIVDGLVEEFEKLHNGGYKLAIVSSNKKKNITKFFNRLDIPEFEKVVCDKGRSLFVKHKTLKKFIKTQRIKPGNIVYVGDEARDVNACKKVKIPCIAVSWGWDTHNRLAQVTKEEMIIDKPNELSPLVSSILE